MAPNLDEDNSLFNFVVQDGYGVKGMVDLGLSKVPAPYVQPPKERIDKKNSRMCPLQPIDLSKLDGPEHDLVAEEIARAASTLGFFQVVNHGMPIELLEKLKDTAHMFFGQAHEKKAVYRKGASPSPLVKYGTSFVPEKEKALEWKDYISMTYTNDVEALQQWPQECKEVLLEYLKTSVMMVRKLLEVLMENLGVKPDNSKIDALIGSKMIISNGTYKSAEHRVRTTSTKSRVSIPVFTMPKPSEKIGPLPELVERDGARFRELVFQDYMNSFFSNAHDGKNSLQFAQINN
ncbi:hypothetical protein Q3G72_009528 [Acer saccharum]|nr:hypothetical protein Q3G72_009528 [Acer saccharum]